MVFFLFFLALELLSRQLRDLWDEGVSKSINSHEKTALKLPIRSASPKIAVRNFCIFFPERTREHLRSAIDNYDPQFLYGNVFNLISLCKSDPSRSKHYFSC
jgi:hypothetical protein